jgi:hypothetical protein
VTRHRYTLGQTASDLISYWTEKGPSVSTEVLVLRYADRGPCSAGRGMSDSSPCPRICGCKKRKSSVRVGWLLSEFSQDLVDVAIK